MKSKLTNKEIETLLSIGFGINTDKKTIQIERDVLYSLVAKTYQIAFKKGSEQNGR